MAKKSESKPLIDAGGLLLKQANEIKPYAKNARTHSKDQIQRVADSITEFGWTNPILIGKDNVIIAGHCRLLAAQSLGITEVPCRDLSHMSKKQAQAYVIADNQLAMNAGWDTSILTEELNELNDVGFDLELLGFPDEELQRLLNPEIDIELDGSEDEITETPEEPITKLGDIWQLGEHRLMCGDSTSINDVDKLLDGNLADMVFTDPPYGYKYESNHYKDGNPHGMLENDDKIVDFIPLLEAVLAENAAIYICGSHQTINIWRALIEKQFQYKNTIVWKKNNWSMGDLKGAYACQHELILFAHKGRIELQKDRASDVWEFDREPPKDHPTQKPVELILFALNNTSKKNDNILDLFGGSGSTLIACEKSNRKCFMMELSPNYCDVIIARWEKLTGQKASLQALGVM